MSMSNERLSEIHEHVRDAFWGLEVKGDTGWAEVVAKADAPELLAEVARLREALTITDEMVERGAVALFRASTDEDWETGPDESERDEWRAQARVALEQK